MAAQKTDVAAQCRALLEDIGNGVFKPVYLLMGEEPYYPEIICRAIIDNCLQDYEKDFNETICYGSDVTVEQVVTAARRFPMMADRQLVVVKDAQNLKNYEDLSVYCSSPLDSTILVILLRGVAANRTKSLYKSVQKIGAVVDSPRLRDYQIPSWVSSYYASRGLRIEPAAAALLAESAGTELTTIEVETDKLVRNLPEGARDVSVEDIERNIGITRQFSVFELTKELSGRNSARALVIARHISDAASFKMVNVMGALFTHFNRILMYGALLSRGLPVGREDKDVALAGVNPYFYSEYDTGVRNYPPAKAMEVMSLLSRYDYLSKGGDGGAADESSLFIELIAKILSV